MKLMSMKRTAKDKRARKKEFQLASPLDAEYHHGLRVHLDGPELDKLGLDKTPRPGEVYELRGHARVTHAAESANEAGGSRHVEMHFTHLGAQRRSERSLRDELEDAAGKK